MQDAIKEFMSTRDLRPLMLPRDTRIRCTPLCARYTTSIYVCGIWLAMVKREGRKLGKIWEEYAITGEEKGRGEIGKFEEENRRVEE